MYVPVLSVLRLMHLTDMGLGKVGRLVGALPWSLQVQLVQMNPVSFSNSRACIKENHVMGWAEGGEWGGWYFCRLGIL
jgi:hypothetical protein